MFNNSRLLQAVISDVRDNKCYQLLHEKETVMVFVSTYLELPLLVSKTCLNSEKFPKKYQSKKNNCLLKQDSYYCLVKSN